MGSKKPLTSLTPRKSPSIPRLTPREANKPSGNNELFLNIFDSDAITFSQNLNGRERDLNKKNVPVTPPVEANSTAVALLLPKLRSNSFPSPRCLKSASRLRITSFKINRCLTKNNQPSRVLRFLTRSEALTSDKWQNESASWAMSSNIVG